MSLIASMRTSFPKRNMPSNPFPILRAFKFTSLMILAKITYSKILDEVIWKIATKVLFVEKRIKRLKSNPKASQKNSHWTLRRV
jgi:hypothetical protein